MVLVVRQRSLLARALPSLESGDVWKAISLGKGSQKLA
jgi:hypothetical protein